MQVDSRRPRWLHLMYRRTNNNWRRLLSKIECPYLRTKVAAICFWDCTNEIAQQSWVEPPYYLKSIMRNYTWAYEAHYSEDDLCKALQQVYYPKRVALKRSKKPKGWNGGSNV